MGIGAPLVDCDLRSRWSYICFFLNYFAVETLFLATCEELSPCRVESLNGWNVILKFRSK